MKKVYLVLAALVIAAAGFSQVSIGGQIKGNAGSLSFKSAEIKDPKKSLQPGFGIGVVADVPLSENVSLRPSLNFMQKKNSLEFVNAGKTSTVKATLNYAELPVNLVYTIPLKAVSLYFGAGPSIGYGISGNVKYKGFVTGEGGQVPADEKVAAFKKEAKGGAGLSRVDVSANAIAGVKFPNGVFVNAGYLKGLRNLADGDGKYKNYGFQLTLGYLIKRS